MTTPSVAQRRLMAAGFRNGAAWGTALETGAGLGALLESDGGLSRTQPYLPAKEADTPFPVEGDLGPIDPVTFAPEFTMRYDLGGLGVALAKFFGTAGNPNSQGDLMYQHTFWWDNEIYGNFVTFALEKLSKIFEVPSAKPVTFDLSIADGFLKGALSFIGNTLIDNSTVNEDTEMSAITYATRGNRIKFSQGNIYINDQVDGDVANETPLIISDLAVHYERPHDSPLKAGSNSIIEPMENGAPIVTVTLTFPRMSSINNIYFTTDFIAEVEKKILIDFIGNVPNAALPYRFKMYFPRMRVIDCKYTWDEVIPASITLQAEKAASDPTGMSYMIPVLVTDNGRTTDYLTA
ncbi:MAG: hypothetical protein KAR42_16720 [candidate division Zixibacteria bacterium]|nr:hypothetical protein [candidate division Zixibacteria bacterium]